MSRWANVGCIFCKGRRLELNAVPISTPGGARLGHSCKRCWSRIERAKDPEKKLQEMWDARAA